MFFFFLHFNFENVPTLFHTVINYLHQVFSFILPNIDWQPPHSLNIVEILLKALCDNLSLEVC